MSYPPGYQDVSFAFGLAERAREVCLWAAALVDDAANERLAAAAVAQGEWRGRFRLEFDLALTGLTAGAGELAAALRQLAGRLAAAADAAVVENARRADLREEWDQAHVPVPTSGPM